jgi:hypothetical protein
MTPNAFSTLPLSPSLLANLDTLGYHEMTTIQAQSLPPVLHGRDLIAQAKTGSGKTSSIPRGSPSRDWCCARRANWPTRWPMSCAGWPAAKATSRS